VERAEAEAIYDAGREACVEVLLRLARLEGRVREVEAENAALRERLGELEQRLKRNSQNSSLPPSQDPPAAPPRPAQSKSGRRAGGQPGREGRHRRLLPLERIDELVEHWPERCRGCGHAFAEEERSDAGPPQRHQVAELPPIAVTVTEHCLHRLACPACGRETRAELPADVPRGAFGPRLQASVAALSVRNRISRRDIAALCADLFGCPLSLGTVDALCQRTSAALAQPYAELRQAIRAAAAVNVDETGWKQAGKRRWLWGACTAQTAAFLITAGRGQKDAIELLGADFTGIVVSDRYSGYKHLPLEQRALCWAHLVRDFRALAEGRGVAAEIGQGALSICQRLFASWHDCRAEGRSRSWLAAEIEPLQHELRCQLERGRADGDRQTKTLCRSLDKLWPALWTFAEVDGVEPTNNAAERGLRHAVIYRKTCFGNQTDDGARFIERMLSIALTCKLQGRSLFAYLTQTLEAATRGDPTPSLVPP
jgi:transposase